MWSSFDLEHALACRNGGLVIQRHNEVRDVIGDLASLVWYQLKREPIVREANGEGQSPALISRPCSPWCMAASMTRWTKTRLSFAILHAAIVCEGFSY